MKYKEGDIIENKNYVRKILGTCGSICHVSRADDFEKFGYTKTESELIFAGYELKNNKITTLTMDEVAKLAGVNVKDLKIVK